jgi:hypothetical protein
MPIYSQTLVTQTGTQASTLAQNLIFCWDIGFVGRSRQKQRPSWHAPCLLKSSIFGISPREIGRIIPDGVLHHAIRYEYFGHAELGSNCLPADQIIEIFGLFSPFSEVFSSSRPSPTLTPVTWPARPACDRSSPLKKTGFGRSSYCFALNNLLMSLNLLHRRLSTQATPIFTELAGSLLAASRQPFIAAPSTLPSLAP